MTLIRSHNVVIEIPEIQLAELHLWLESLNCTPRKQYHDEGYVHDGKHHGHDDHHHHGHRGVPPVVIEVARQVAIGIQKPFRPCIGDWVYHQGKPSKIIGKTSGLEYQWVLEIYESQDSCRFTVATVGQGEVKPYTVPDPREYPRHRHGHHHIHDEQCGYVCAS